MKKILTFLLFIFFIVTEIFSQCAVNVDFNTWAVAGQPANGNWVVQGGGSQVRQTVNGENTYFVSPFDLMNVRITGNFRTTDTDDDWMGFVFSFLNPLGPIDDYDTWLFDWKQENQGAAPSGMSLCRIEGTITPNMYANYFNAHQNGPEFTVVQNTFGGPGWIRNFDHQFELRLTYTRATIFIDGNLVFDEQGCFKPGRFGFYNKSQEDCYYSNFQYDLFIDFFVNNDGKSCVGDTVDFEFVSPCVNANLSQYQRITWDFGDGTPPVVNNSPTFSNANVKYAYQSPGSYTATLTVLDNNGCSSTSTRVIDVRNPISIPATLNPPPCNGGFNGSITANPTGGFGNYIYNWNGGANIQQTWTGISAGTYSLYITDGICSADTQYTLTQPTPLTATTSKTDASCGQSNGSVSISISGGTPPYQNISWAGVAGATRTGLGAGTYIADFRDANGCSALLQYRETISALPCGINTNINVTNVNCFNGNDGEITLTVTGGAANPTITWSNGLTGSTITGLSAGTYTYTYSDAVPGNNFTGTVIVTSPGADMIVDLSTIGISCSGSNDGKAIASVLSGGTLPYTYTWSRGQPNNAVAENLSPGPISVTVTDASGCTATASDNVSNLTPLSVNIVTIMDSCFNSGKGSAIAAVTGGTPPYSYSWSNFYSQNNNENLRAGNYTLTVTDNKNCTVVENVVITGPIAPLSYTYSKADISCYGNTTGSFLINPSGGTQGYVIAWDNPTISGFNPTGLSPGSYNYTITDSYGCVVFGGDTIKQPDFPLTFVSENIGVSCNSGNDGLIRLIITGGTPPYSYLGNVISTDTLLLTDLIAGTYTGVISDSNNCTIQFNEVISEPAPQTLDVTVADNPCFGAALGSASANFINATGSVNYIWSNNATTPTISSLVAGTYSVSATDQNNCLLIGDIVISEPAEVNLIVDVIDALCFGTNGSATANPVGGTAPFVFEWSNGLIGQTVNIPAGNYSVTSTDAQTCKQTGTLIINEPAGINVITQQTDISCYNGNDGEITFNVSGGTGMSYSFSWQPNVSSSNTAMNLTAGVYFVTITDMNSCNSEYQITLTEPNAIGLDATETFIDCYGNNSGKISAVTSGGSVPFNYSIYKYDILLFSSQTGLFDNLFAGDYTIIVEDNNNCFDTVDVTIIQPDSLSAQYSVNDVSCFNYDNGEIIVTAFGGTPGYTYSISNDIQNQNGVFTNLIAGNYIITVLDINNCETVLSTNITQPDPVSINIEITEDTISFGESITISVSSNINGDPIYTWSPTDNLSCNNCANPKFSGNTTTTYTLTIINDFGCIGNDNVTIYVVPDYTVFVPNAFSPNGDGNNDTWKVFGNIPGMTELQIDIFNRWGEKVFTGSLDNIEWDGTYKGNFLNPGVYAWHVKTKFLDGYTKNLKGSLTLIR